MMVKGSLLSVLTAMTDEHPQLSYNSLSGDKGLRGMQYATRGCHSGGATFHNTKSAGAPE
jgi:hypothetical protein